jgi:hypothetical protein
MHVTCQLTVQNNADNASSRGCLCLQATSSITWNSSTPKLYTSAALLQMPCSSTAGSSAVAAMQQNVLSGLMMRQAAQAMHATAAACSTCLNLCNASFVQAGARHVCIFWLAATYHMACVQARPASITCTSTAQHAFLHCMLPCSYLKQQPAASPSGGICVMVPYVFVTTLLPCVSIRDKPTSQQRQHTLSIAVEANEHSSQHSPFNSSLHCSPSAGADK